VAVWLRSVVVANSAMAVQSGAMNERLAMRRVAMRRAPVVVVLFKCPESIFKKGAVPLRHMTEWHKSAAKWEGWQYSYMVSLNSPL
jgi:hypothetical protein